MRSDFEKMIVYDLETGGLFVKENPLTEIAMVVIDLQALEIVDEMSQLIKPYNDELIYTQEAWDLTKLSLERLNEGGLLSQEVADLTADFIGKHSEECPPILGGHNIKKFDNPFLIKFMKEHGHNLEKMSPLEHCYDSLKTAQLMYWELPNYSLGTCAFQVGITIKEAHRALPDTQANAKYIIQMLKNLRGEGQAGSTYVRRKYNFNF